LCSVRDEERLYREFGVNAELLIDHAWGWEPCTIADIKSYVPESSSLSVGQVLSTPYDFEKGRLIVMEMTDQLVLDLVEKGLVTDQMVLTVGYDTENISKRYSGETEADRYGRQTPKQAHGSVNLGCYSSSTKLIMAKMDELYSRIVKKDLTVRRMYVVANHTIPESEIPEQGQEQLDMFTDYERKAEEDERDREALESEKRLQKSIIELKKKFGKNAVLKGMNLEEGATARERNRMVGGHKA
jgi:DNA polymerase V